MSLAEKLLYLFIRSSFSEGKMNYDQWVDQLSKKVTLQEKGSPKDLTWMYGFSEDCDEEELPSAPAEKKATNPLFKFD